MTDFFAEVDEALRYERILNFWKQWGSWVIAFGVLAVLGTAAGTGYRAWKENALEIQSSKLSVLHESGQPNPAKIRETVEALSDPGLETLALLSAAAFAAGQGARDPALDYYEDLAANESRDPVLRDLAEILRASYIMDTLNLTIDPQQSLTNIHDNLKPIAEDSANVWRWHARLIQAAAAAEMGERQKAAKILAPFNDQDAGAPPGLARQAQQLRGLYEFTAKKDNKS